MKRALITIAFVLFLSASAWSFGVIFEPTPGVYDYRPVGAYPSTVKPGIGIAPSSVEVAFDFVNAPSGYEDAVKGALWVWQGVSTATLTYKNPYDNACSPILFCHNTDGVNDLVWIASNWPFGEDTLAITWFENYDETTGAVWETDVYFNGPGYNWFIGNTPDPNGYDLISVATHELGHVACLDDLYDWHFYTYVMYGYIEAGDMSDRVLSQDDMDGLTFLYPKDAYPVPGVTAISNDSLTYHNTLALNQGVVQNNVSIEGFGFVFTDTTPTTIETSVWRGGTQSATLLTGDLVFKDCQHLTITLDLSLNPATGEYDLVVKNPNGWSGTLESGIQSNLTTNVPPTVATAGSGEGYVGNLFTTCATGTDSDGPSSLTYKWTLVEQPIGSNITPVNADQKCVSFTPVVTGWYGFDVSVFDGIVWSAADGLEIEIGIPQPPASTSGDGNGCGCTITGGQPHGTVLPLLAVLPVWYLLRRRLIRARSAPTSRGQA